MDATNMLLRALNASNAGPWRSLGAQHFYGVELERDGLFDPAERAESTGAVGRPCKARRIDWKARYRFFNTEVPLFRAPFGGSEVTAVSYPDEVAYCCCRLRADLLCPVSAGGAYFEVEVLSNPDNLSLALVDFEAGGRSSVTFSPDTGAVIRERKVREAPRKVEGAYIQPLATIPSGRRFQGFMGLYIHRGHVAFFRRMVGDADPSRQSAVWQSTGFVTDLSWAEGRRLTPCLAFRDEGAYRVRVARFGAEPPVVPERTAMAYQDANWFGLDWEAGQHAGRDT